LRAQFPDAEAVHRQVVSAWQARDWDRLRSLLHPEGTFEPTTAGGRFVDAEDLVGSLEAADRTVFSVCGLTYEKLADDFAIAAGYVRHLHERGHSLTRAVWLIEVRDGLAYRSTPFRSRKSALTEYEGRRDLARALMTLQAEGATRRARPDGDSLRVNSRGA
jgi:hypothetical protein